MAVDYDWDDNVPTTAVNFMNNERAVVGSLWEPLTLTVDCARLNSVIKERYVADVIKTADSQRFAYAGYLMIGAITPIASTFDLIVKYTVRFVNSCLPMSTTVVAGGSFANNLSAGVNTPFTYLPVLPAVPIVQSAINGIASLTGFNVGANAYNITPSGVGTLTLVCRDNITAAAPSSYAADTALNAHFFDWSGALLGQALTTTSANGVRLTQSGVDDAATWAVNGGSTRRSLSIDLRALRSYLSGALSYIVPFLVSTAGKNLAATQMTGSYKEF